LITLETPPATTRCRADPHYGADPRYRADIDGLRAVAVISVLLYHAGVPGFSGGYVGVDVFFVISGYLITGHIAADIARQRFSLVAFYERRFRRILPALTTVLLLTWLAASWLMLPSYLINASKALIAAATSVSNIYFWLTSNYFAPSSALQPFLHMWSLSVEEQFYLFIPVLMMAAARPIRQRWVLLFAPLCLGCFALSAYATNTAATANFYLLPTRAWELGLGSLTATVALLPVVRRLTAELLGLAGLLLIVLPVLLFDQTTSFPGWNALYPCLGSALLIHLGRHRRSAVTAVLGTRPFVSIGLISYSLYLVHWPIISFTYYRTAGVLGAPQITFVVAASLVLATLCWRFIERPFRGRDALLTRRGVLLGGAGAIAVASLLGVIGLGAAGFPGRFPGFAEQQVAAEATWKPDRCFLVNTRDYHRWSPADCVRIATGPRRILLWGDSFAAQYTPGIVADAAAIKATVIQYTAAGCLPLLDTHIYGERACRDFSNHALDLIREEKIDTVIVAGRWSALTRDEFAEIGSTLAVLDRLGVRVIVIGQSPEFTVDSPTLAFLKGSSAPNAVNRWPQLARPWINEALAAIQGGHRFIDPMPVFCQTGECVYQDHGVYLFGDAVHYSAAGSDRAVRAALAPALAAAP
jgi:peptidoglycan/LPS O-acetylase OafA/YrhL